MKSLFRRLVRSSSAGWCAIDAFDGLHAVSLDMARKVGDKHHVLNHVSLPNEALSKESLRSLAAQLGGTAKDWVLVMGRDDYQIFQVEKSSVRVEEMEASLRLGLAALIEYPPSEANLSWLDVPVPEGQSAVVRQLFLAATKKIQIDMTERVFVDGQIKLVAADIRESAQRNLSAQIEGAGKGAVCMLFADQQGVQLTVTHKGELFMQRYIRESLYNDTNPDATWSLDQKIDRVASEVQRSMNFIQRNFAGLNVSEILVGPQLSDLDLAGRLAPGFIESVRNFNLNEVFDWPADSELNVPAVQARYFYALGAALRFAEDAQ